MSLQQQRRSRTRLPQGAPSLGGRGWALYAALWAGVGVFAGSQTFLTYRITTGDALAWPVYSISVSYWCSWGLAGAVAVYAAMRLPLGRRTWLRRVPAHVAISAGLSLAVLLLHGAIRQWLGYPVSTPLPVAYLSSLDTGLITYASILLGMHVLAYQRAVQLRDRHAAELAARLSEARLAALRSQLHPHFLFNTLNGIQAFIRDAPDVAEEMVAGLADLLRIALEEAPRQQIPLDHELEFVTRYLDLQRLRLGERLDVRIRVQPEARSALVPALILQPLAENAIEHGIAERRTGGRIEIDARLDGQALHLVVRDDGPGPDASSRSTDGAGIALRNIRERLERLHGRHASLTLGMPAGGGTEARVLMPYIAASEGAAPEAPEESPAATEAKT